MKLADYKESYNKLTTDLLKEKSEEEAMSLAVGGDFDAVGALEYYLLMQNQLQPNDTVIDVGCGSGRLAYQLRNFLSGRYIGIDIVPELYKYAEKICGRTDWEFLSAPGLSIPQENNSADFICFFSVFTHLLHEESYKYLADARRVIKPGGKIIFSFLEFALPGHWPIFEGTVANSDPDRVLNQFIDRYAIRAWAEHLNLQILEINDGDKPHITLEKVVRWDNGVEMKEKGNLGQSVCILSK